MTLVQLVADINDTNANFRIARSEQERNAALRAYQHHLTFFSSLSPAEEHVSHYHKALTMRMIGECYMSLQRWLEAKRSLLVAEQHCDDAVQSLPAGAFGYDELMQQQQVHHLLADTYVALSEEAARVEDSCDSALTALAFASSAEQEAAAMLRRCSRAQDAEVNEAELSARINLATVLIRLRDLAASTPAVALPDSAARYSQLALRQLKTAYKSAVSFCLHQYQHLAYWHQHRVHVADGELPEALRCIEAALDVFVRLQKDSVSRQIEWPAAAWQKERADTRMTGAQLIMDMLAAAEEDGDEEGLPLQERQQELGRARDWLRAARVAVRRGHVGLSAEETSRLSELWERMRRMQRGLDAAHAGPVRKRRRIIED